MYCQVSNNKKALKSGFWYTVANFLTRGIVLITTPFFSRILTTEEFGCFHVYANWQSLFLIICSMEFALTINRARLDYDDKELNNYIGNCIVLNVIVTIVLFLIILCSNWFRKNVLMLDIKYLLIMFFYLLACPAFELFQAVQRVKYKYRLSATLSFLSVFLGAVLAVFGTFLFDDKLLGRIIGQYAPVIILGFIFAIVYLLKIKKIEVSYCRYGMNISIPLIFSYLGSQILTSSDKIVVQHLETAEAVAYIGIVTTCSHIMTILVQSINNAWAPWFYDKLEIKEYKSIHRIFNVYSFMICMCTFGVVLLGPELVKILGGEKYRNAVFLIPPSISLCIFNQIIFQYVNIETYYKKTRFTALATGIVAILNIYLDIYFVQIFGYISVSFVTFFCYWMLMILHSFYVKRIDENNLVTIWNIVISMLTALGIVLVSYLTYLNDILRLILIVILILIVVVVIINFFRCTKNMKK